MKVRVGNDDFCIYCMDWQEFDENGRCKICKHFIYKKNKTPEKEISNMRESTPSYDSEEYSDDTEY